MKYSIEVNYSSGDTQSDYQIVKNLDIEWDSKDEAIAALQCLKEHWVFYMKQDDAYGQKHENIVNSVKSKEWYDPISPNFSFIVTVGGEKIPVHTPWNGYFETLHTARVVAVENPDIVDFDSLDWKKL